MIHKKAAAVISVFVASVPSWASALGPEQIVAACPTPALKTFFGFQPWYACLGKAPDGSPTFTKLSDIFLIIFPLIDSLIKIGALVAIGVIFYMLIQMITARGDAGKIKSSVEGIRDAVIGLIICLVSVAIVQFISGAFSTS